jgi:hypothetical protein
MISRRGYSPHQSHSEMLFELTFRELPPSFGTQTAAPIVFKPLKLRRWEYSSEDHIRERATTSRSRKRQPHLECDDDSAAVSPASCRRLSVFAGSPFPAVSSDDAPRQPHDKVLRPCGSL